MGTTTPNRGLYKPAQNEVGWATKVNANFDNLDATADKSYVDTQDAATLAAANGAAPGLAPVQSVAGKTGAVSLVEGDIANLVTDLAAKEVTAHKDAASGYAGLDSAGMLKSGEFKITRNRITSTSYAIQDSDRGKLIELNNATASTLCTLTLAAPGGGSFADGWFVTIKNINTNYWLLTSSGGTEYADAIAIPPDTCFCLYSDGTNFYLARHISTGGWLYPVWGQNISTLGGGTAGSLLTNKIVYTVNVQTPITLRRLTCNINTAVGGAFIYTGFYTLGGVFITGTQSKQSAASTGIQSTAYGTPFTLMPGVYYIFVQADTTGIQVDLLGGTATAENVLNKNIVRLGNATNGLSGGAVPATLGSLSAGTPSICHFLYEA